MIDEQPDKENEVTPEGAVEIQEEDLEQASGGMDYLKVPVDQSLKQNLADPSVKLMGDGSVKPAGYDLKGYDLKKI